MKPLIIILILCSVSNARADSGNVKFFVMGHIHAWFQTHVAPVIDENREDLDFLVFTGDVVMNSTAENWESVYSIIHKLEIETYIAPGNHDLTFKNPETKETTYAYETFQTYSGTSYGSFRKGKNLFLLIDTITPKHNDSQRALFDSEIDDLDGIDNVFVFSHYLSFVHEASKFICMRNHVHFDKSSSSSKHNMWIFIKDKLEGSDVRIYYFSGDIGIADHANRKQAPAIYDKTENITILASGMGNAKQSYFDVAIKDGEVDIKIVPYDSNLALKLTDFELNKYDFCNVEKN
jgi:hypothetical protein